MSHHETETKGTDLPSRTRWRVRWTARGVALGLVVLAAASVSCSPIGNSGTGASDTTATVIATAAPVTTTTPVAFEPSVEPVKEGYHLVFNDEFVGPKFSRKRWMTSLPWGNTNRDEQQYYTSDSLSQSGGLLTITATKQPTNGKPFASGVISSSDRFEFKYGYSEIRAQIPPGTGLWSAFWLVSPLAGSNDEVDVMEVLGSDPSEGFAVLHYGTMAAKGKALATYRDPDFSAGFHTFGVDWQPEHLIWYVDGVERYRVTEHVPSAPMYLIANLAVGGRESWSGAPNRYTQFPASLRIDYIRVFQRN